MAGSYPLQSLLRPPVEWGSSLASGLAALAIWHYPANVLLTPLWGKWVGAGFALFALHRFWQGWQVVRYQCHLKKLPYYTIRSKDIPISRKKLFLGKGFRWQAIHTQRLYDLSKNGKDKYVKPGKLYQWARKAEIAWENKPLLQSIVRCLSSQSLLNPLRSLPNIGGDPALHGVEPNEQSVFMNLSERTGHTLVQGTTRTGKSRLAENLCAQDIRRGDVVIVFDPKGDADLLRRMYFECQQSGRLHAFMIFHCGFPEVSARYNPIGHFSGLQEVATRVANQLPSSGESAAFKEFAWRFINIITKTLVALGKTPSYKLLNQYILNIDPLLWEYGEQTLPNIDQQWQQKVEAIQRGINEKTLPYHLKSRPYRMIALLKFVEQQHMQDKILNDLCAVFNYDQTYYQKITASVSPLLEKLTTGKVADLISPDYFDMNDKRPIFDWLQVIRGKKVVYIGLDALSDTTVATAVGNSMFADLCSVAGQLYKFGVGDNIAGKPDRRQFYNISLHADEFNELIGEEFVPLLNKAGGAGIQVTAYTQTISDIEARLGNKAKTGQVLGNLNTIICLRVLDAETARFFTHKLPQRVQVMDVVHHTAVNDARQLRDGFSTSQSDQMRVSEVPLLSPDHLLSLPKGQAFCLFEGGQLWKIRMPLPKDDMRDMPDDIEDMAKVMQANYRTRKDWATQ